jgi:hypothetical protein
MPIAPFRRAIIGELENTASGMNTRRNVADLDHDGKPDVFVSGRDGRMARFHIPGRPSAHSFATPRRGQANAPRGVNTEGGSTRESTS